MEFTQEELDLLEVLHASNVKIPKIPEPPEYKVLKTKVLCKLCFTVTIQAFNMVKEGKTAWVRDSEINLNKTVLPKDVEVVTSTRPTCWACKEVLIKKSKEVLVDMLIANTYYEFLQKCERGEG